MDQGTIKNIIDYAKAELHETYEMQEIQSIMRIALEHFLSVSPTTILAHQNTKVSNSDYFQMKQVVEKLKKQEPIQYILGETEFYGRKFVLNPSVLIPRSETEELVHWIIHESRAHGPSILDVGTGSGCIAVTLAAEITNARVLGIDVSEGALAVAQKNAKLSDQDVRFIQYDVLGNEPLSTHEKFDVVVSNPPYVRLSEKEKMYPNVLEYEPHLALFVDDDDALLFYRKITEMAKKELKNGGTLYFEMNEALGEETKKLLINYGFVGVEIKSDINGKQRMIKAQKPF